MTQIRHVLRALQTRLAPAKQQPAAPRPSEIAGIEVPGGPRRPLAGPAAPRLGLKAAQPAGGTVPAGRKAAAWQPESLVDVKKRLGRTLSEICKEEKDEAAAIVRLKTLLPLLAAPDAAQPAEEKTAEAQLWHEALAALISNGWDKAANLMASWVPKHLLYQEQDGQKVATGLARLLMSLAPGGRSTQTRQAPPADQAVPTGPGPALRKRPSKLSEVLKPAGLLRSLPGWWPKR